MSSQVYTSSLQKHYEDYFGITGYRKSWDIDPHNKIHPGFYILEFPPNSKHNMWVYCTVGMSSGRTDRNLIELFIYSPKQADALVELLTVITSYHRNDAPFNIHHTFNIGQPWLPGSICDYGFISLPYLDGEELELFKFEGTTIHCYWVIPITENERAYKIKNGFEALEDLFEENAIDYLNPFRKSLI